MLFAMLNKDKKKSKKIEMTEGVDECTRQIVAANMTMMVSMSNQLYDLKQLMLQSNKQLTELKEMIKKED